MPKSKPVCIPKCARPSEPGRYLCMRVSYRSTPEYVEIRLENGQLQYIGGNSFFPLAKLEPSAVFFGPVEVEKE